MYAHYCLDGQDYFIAYNGDFVSYLFKLHFLLNFNYVICLLDSCMYMGFLNKKGLCMLNH